MLVLSNSHPKANEPYKLRIHLSTIFAQHECQNKGWAYLMSAEGSEVQCVMLLKDSSPGVRIWIVYFWLTASIPLSKYS